jgi:hypothetical protein
LDPGETKNDDAREAYLNEECLGDITLLYASRGACPYVFHHKRQRIGEFKRAWRTACIKAGLCEPLIDGKGNPVKNKKGNPVMVPNKLFHDLRRTAVRNLIRAGTPERIAMQITGHRTREVFDRYNIVNQDDMRRAIERLGHHNSITICPKSRQPEVSGWM